MKTESQHPTLALATLLLLTAGAIAQAYFTDPVSRPSTSVTRH